jgi:hypothetical protein
MKKAGADHAEWKRQGDWNEVLSNAQSGCWGSGSCPQQQSGGHATGNLGAAEFLPLPTRVFGVIDDSPTRPYGPQLEGAAVHHNPTPGPADQPFLYRHTWGTISLALRHPQSGPLALPLRAMLYVRRQTMASIPRCREWYRFATPLQLAARLAEWLVPLLKQEEKTVWVVIDSG